MSKDRTSGLLKNLEKKSEPKIDNAEKEMYASMLGKIKSNYSYNLPALADAILDIIKEDTGEYKNDILNNIIVNHVNDEIIVRAKERLIQKSSKK